MAPTSRHVDPSLAFNQPDVHHHATKPAHRCHDTCSALNTRIVETFQCKFKY